jgi:hypothetical protein
MKLASALNNAGGLSWAQHSLCFESKGWEKKKKKRVQNLPSSEHF